MTIIEFEETFGEYALPEDLVEKLTGKTYEEQLKFFKIVTTTYVSEYSYGECDSSYKQKKSFALDEYNGFRGIVVHKGLIVGAALLDWNDKSKQLICLYGDAVTTYSVSDDDGPSSTNRTDTDQLTRADEA